MSDSSIRWGIIGCGDVVRRRVANAIHETAGATLLAGCRRDENQLREFCEEFQVERAYTDAQQLIDDPDIDAVYIATPACLHLPQTLASARAGKHVLVEKPMAMTVDECDQMIKVCREQNVRLGVAYYRRFYPVVDRMRELIDAGAIGAPLSVSVTTATDFSLEPEKGGYWRVLLDEGGGGALMDIGSHRINLMLHMFGPVEQVKCLHHTVVGNHEAEDCALLICRFQTGVHGTLQCYFGAGLDPDEFTVLGTEGRLSSAPLNEGQLVLESRGERVVEQCAPSANFNAPLIEDFCAAICEGRSPCVSGEEGRAANAVMATAYEDAAH